MVSIVLVTYNRAQRLKQSIRDILNQNFIDFELIICDDCSPDETQEVCEHFASLDGRIRYFRHDSNLRMPENLNFGIRHARYEYIAILHDGDRFRRDLIEQWYNAISQNPNVGFVFNTIATTDENNQIVQTFKNYDEGVISKEELLENGFYKKKRFDSLVYGEAMVRRSLVERYGYLKPEYGFYADVDLWIEILHTHDAYYCTDALYTGPSKSIMPQQFEMNLVEVFMYLYEMHFVHRKRTFRGNPRRSSFKMAYFYVSSCFYLTYYLLLTIKNFPLSRFFEAPKKLKKHWFLLIPWFITGIFYPVLRPLLQFLGNAKRQFIVSKAEVKSKWSVVNASESGG
ncbi:MAG: glycosyltransferase family 2 protein [Chryseolinea sp.]